MKRIFAAAFAALASIASAATLSPIQLLNPAGSTAGQAIVSNGPGAAPGWGSSFGAISASAGTFTANPVTATDVGNYRFFRNATHTGGAPGFTNSTIRIDHTVGANVTDFEWGFTSVMNNSATAGENVAIYGQGNRQTITTGPTWGGVMEAQEKVAINDPTTGLVGLEVDNRSNGTDANHNRIGIDVVGARYDTAGAPTAIWAGVRVQAGGDAANVAFGNGFLFQANGTTAFATGGTTAVGFDTSAGTISQAAFKMAAGQALAFDAGATKQLAYVGGLRYAISGAQKFLIRDSGGVDITDTAAENSSLTITNTAANGAVVKITGDGATTPSKHLRVQAGSLGIINDAFNAQILTLTDGGDLSVNGAITPSQTAGIVGTTTNNNANAGSVGEYVTNSATGVSLTTVTTANITSVSLTAGDWDVSGAVTYSPAGSTTVTGLTTGISTTSATLPGNNTGGYNLLALPFTTGAAQVHGTQTVRISISGTTTVYLVAQAQFGVSTMTANGFIRARRVR